jgi:hypothetical protein
MATPAAGVILKSSDAARGTEQSLATTTACVVACATPGEFKEEPTVNFRAGRLLVRFGEA